MTDPDNPTEYRETEDCPASRRTSREGPGAHRVGTDSTHARSTVRPEQVVIGRSSVGWITKAR